MSTYVCNVLIKGHPQGKADICKVTIRDLLHMQSGIGDYDDKVPVLVPWYSTITLFCLVQTGTCLLCWCYISYNVCVCSPVAPAPCCAFFLSQAIFHQQCRDPLYDISPVEFMHKVNKTFVCPPGTCLYYSSLNFVIAGMVLAQVG